MIWILEPQYGKDFVGRQNKLEELKEKIKDNGFVIVTGNRGIGKTNLTLVVEEALNEEKTGFLKKKPCYHVNGSLFYPEINKIFAPSKRPTSVSGTVTTPIVGAGAGVGWNPRETFILEYLEKSKEKILFVENAHELKKEDFETILEATRRNGSLRFVLEIATPYLPDVRLKAGSYEIVDLSELRDEDIEKIVRKECTLFSQTIVHRIVALSKGYPYVARSLAYICDNKDSEEEVSLFLNTLSDEDMKHNLDKIHGEVLATLDADSQAVIKRLAVAPETLTLNLITAFCGDNVDTPLNDLIERGILVQSGGKYRVYHPLFRDYLRNIQPVALKNKKALYSEAMERVKSDIDSIYLLFEVLTEPDIFETLLKQTENYAVINSVGLHALTQGNLKQALCAFTHLLKISKGVDKEWESYATGNIGHVYFDKGKLDKALVCYEKALGLLEKLGIKEEIAKVYVGIGNVCQIKGESDEALRYYEKVFELQGERGIKELLAVAIGSKGNVYFDKGKLDKALVYYERAFKMFEELDSKENLAKGITSKGNVYFSNDKRDKALECYQQALKLDEELGCKEGIAADLGNIGNIYFTKGELDKALGYYEKALGIFKDMESRIETARTLMNLGDVFVLKGDNERASEYYREAKDLATVSSVFEDVSKRLKILEDEQNAKDTYQNTKRI